MEEFNLDSSDVRAIAIFGGYLSICGLLTGIIVNDLITDHNKLKKRASSTATLVFASCATVSLGITWYYMLSFFSLSYRAWASEYDIKLPTQPQNVNELSQWLQTIHLGAWLKDVKLFNDAWEIAMESHGRLLWSQPIFFITAVWAFFIGEQVSIRKIRHGWMYMVLGQIVAISFAQSLFYLAVTLSDPESEGNRPIGSNKAQAKSVSNMAVYHSLLHRLIFALVAFPVIMIPAVVNTPFFLWVLALPHLALLLPPLIDPLLVTQSLTAEDRIIIQAENSRLYRFICFAALIPQGKMIFDARNNTSADQHLHRHSAVYVHPILESPFAPSSNAFYGMLASLYDHPAVSSVGMDSILCILNYQIWRLLKQQK